MFATPTPFATSFPLLTRLGQDTRIAPYLRCGDARAIKRNGFIRSKDSDLAVEYLLQLWNKNLAQTLK